LNRLVKKSIDFFLDDHPGDDEERPRTAWAVSVVDDCDGCQDLRVELNLEEEGGAGAGITAHLSAANARRLRAAVAAALREIGEEPA
jgi:hypothetical protein